MWMRDNRAGYGEGQDLTQSGRGGKQASERSKVV